MKWAFNRTKHLLKEICLYRHFFVQTAVTSQRKRQSHFHAPRNDREIEGFHPLSHGSDLAPLCHPLSASFIIKSVNFFFYGGGKRSHHGPLWPKTCPKGPFPSFRREMVPANLIYRLPECFVNSFSSASFSHFPLDRLKTYVSRLLVVLETK